MLGDVRWVRIVRARLRSCLGVRSRMGWGVMVGVIRLGRVCCPFFWVFFYYLEDIWGLN